MSTPTTLNLNWQNVKFTPQGGSAITITRVSNVSFDPGGSLIDYAGDGNRFPVGKFLVMSKPTAQVESQNISVLNGLTPGTAGVFIATLLDITNLAAVGGGGIGYTLNNACVANNPFGARFGEIASGTLNMEAYSTDGVTSPLVAAAV